MSIDPRDAARRIVEWNDAHPKKRQSMISRNAFIVARALLALLASRDELLAAGEAMMKVRYNPNRTPSQAEDAAILMRAAIARAAPSWMDIETVARALLAGPSPDVKEALRAEDVQWVTNDIAELGVKIGNQFFFLYKGESLVYEDPTHEGDAPGCPRGSPMHWRPVFKREFGECAHPIYSGTVSLDDSDEWKPLPAAKGETT